MPHILWKLHIPLNPYISYDELTSDEKYIADIIKEYKRGNNNQDIISRIWDFKNSGFVVSNIRGGLHRLMYKLLYPSGTLHTVTAVDGYYSTKVVFEPEGITFPYIIPDRVAETGQLNILIDLNYSKRKLLEDFQRFIDY